MPARPPGHPGRRGRPPKFGRPARLVAVTLPTDVVAWLEALHTDIGRAIVRLHDEAVRRHRRPDPAQRPSAELVDVGEARALIVVDPEMVRGLTGVAAIPFGEGRAFLALEPSWTMADLELSVVDWLEREAGEGPRRDALTAFRAQLRAWRTDRTMALEQRAIIVVTRRSKGKEAAATGAHR